MGVQEAWLRAQIELALEVGKPLFFHERGCHDRFLQVVSEYAGRIGGRAVINCFNGTAFELRAYLDLGFYIALTGLLCNTARGLPLRDVVAHIPLDRLLIGTDAPHLIPFTMPKPYPRDNEPAFLPHVLVTVAECMGKTVEEIAAATTANARRVFGLAALPFDGKIRVPLASVTTSPNARMAIARVAPVKPPLKAAVTSATATATAAESASTTPASSASKEEAASSSKEGGEAPAASTSGSSSSSAEKEKEKATESEKSKKKKKAARATFEHDGKRYACTPKEKAILQRQRGTLSAAAFAALLADFGLTERK
jgi:hypothetical protein